MSARRVVFQSPNVGLVVSHNSYQLLLPTLFVALVSKGVDCLMLDTLSFPPSHQRHNCVRTTHCQMVKIVLVLKMTVVVVVWWIQPRLYHLQQCWMLLAIRLQLPLHLALVGL